MSSNTIAIIGSGPAGLAAAILLKQKHPTRDIVVISPGATDNGSMAKSGVTDPGSERSLDDFLADLNNNAGYTSENPNPRQRDLVTYGPKIKGFLTNCGFGFDEERNQAPGHSAPRLLCSGTNTGASLMKALRFKAETLGVRFVKGETVYQVSKDPSGTATGVWTYDKKRNTRHHPAGHIIFATGGISRLWANTTNGVGATGNGHVALKKAGAALKDMHRIQYHPTAVPTTDLKKPWFLMPGALRKPPYNAPVLWVPAAEGQPSYEHKGKSIAEMTRKHLSELLIHQIPLGDFFYLDLSNLPEEKKRSFQKYCYEGTWLVPIAPAAHFTFGGVSVNDTWQVLDVEGNPLGGLYAIGELSDSQMHGENRLAGNSLMGCFVSALSVVDENIFSKQNQHDVTISGDHPTQPPAWTDDEERQIRCGMQSTFGPGFVNAESLANLQTNLSSLYEKYEANPPYEFIVAQMVVDHYLESATQELSASLVNTRE